MPPRKSPLSAAFLYVFSTRAKLSSFQFPQSQSPSTPKLCPSLHIPTTVTVNSLLDTKNSQTEEESSPTPCEDAVIAWLDLSGQADKALQSPRGQITSDLKQELTLSDLMGRLSPSVLHMINKHRKVFYENFVQQFEKLLLKISLKAPWQTLKITLFYVFK